MKITTNNEPLKLKLNINEMKTLYNYIAKFNLKLYNNTVLGYYQTHILQEFNIKLALVMFKIETNRAKPIKIFKINQLEKHTLSCLFSIAPTNDGYLLVIQEKIIKGLIKFNTHAA